MLDNLVDLKSLSEPLVKLIETIGNGLGMAFKPLSIYLTGKADANRYLTMEKAKTEAQIYNEERMDESRFMLQERALSREARRQNNIKDVAEIAANELKGETGVSNKPVDTDWITRFFNISEDVSDDKLKIIWGKILAGEVKSPGSYSTRTLETLRNLTKDEAEIFIKACNMAVTNTNHMVINTKHEDDGKGFGLTFTEASILMEAGLLSTSFEAMLTKEADEDRISLLYQDQVILIETKKDKMRFKVLIFTNVGNEIYGIIPKTFDKEYIKSLAKYLKSNGATKVGICKYKEIDNNSLTYDINDLRPL